MILFILIAFGSLGLASMVYAQEESAEDYNEQYTDAKSTDFFWLLCEEVGFDVEEAESDGEKSAISYCYEVIERKREAISEARSTFWWHRLSSRVSFVLAHLFVLIGVAAAIAEFLQARRLREAGAKAESAELSIGLDGVAVKTALSGIILLSLALGFYFLYLKFVYPVQFI
jgi:hypothetical protein